jgi:hypothetical protein
MYEAAAEEQQMKRRCRGTSESGDDNTSKKRCSETTAKPSYHSDLTDALVIDNETRAMGLVRWWFYIVGMYGYAKRRVKDGRWPKVRPVDSFCKM